MSSLAISLLDLQADNRVCMEADDYQKKPGKWCAGCGDFGALNAVKRLMAKQQHRMPVVELDDFGIYRWREFAGKIDVQNFDTEIGVNRSRG